MRKDYRFEGMKFYRKGHKKSRHLKAFIREYERILRNI